jgi:hypothetical protein
MPHWYGAVSTNTPEFLKSCQGDLKCIDQKLHEKTPPGVSIMPLLHLENAVGVVVAGGPEAEQWLRNDLEASDVKQLAD